ncbi:hypothetical protein RhiJN_03555 [Ceratobasidium sp. AG-Ba]|nr:hypothetical protein RhiJN_03555 [Ceratobasidium sp. AG-Ba]QRW04451.1 hypothetical protein RhiLY_03450 [Ceratobasidium sp. AG-Ba]
MHFKSNSALITKLTTSAGYHFRFRNNKNRHLPPQPAKGSRNPTQDHTSSIQQGAEYQRKRLEGLNETFSRLFKKLGPKEPKEPKESFPTTLMPSPLDIDPIYSERFFSEIIEAEESSDDLDNGKSSADVLLELIDAHFDSIEELNLVSHDSSNLTDILRQFPDAPAIVHAPRNHREDAVYSAIAADNNPMVVLADRLDGPYRFNNGENPIGGPRRQQRRKQILKKTLEVVKVAKLCLDWLGRKDTPDPDTGKTTQFSRTDGLFDRGRRLFQVGLWSSPSTRDRPDAWECESSISFYEDASLRGLYTTSLEEVRYSLDSTETASISTGYSIPMLVVTCDEESMRSTTSSLILDYDPDFLSPLYVRTHYPGDFDDSETYAEDDELDDSEESESTESYESSADLTWPITPTYLDTFLPTIVEECLDSMDSDSLYDHEGDAIGVAC